jgi:NitT/TauT family transport system permease protein
MTAGGEATVQAEALTPPTRRRAAAPRWLPFLIPLAIVVTAWEGVARLADTIVFPPLSEILPELWKFIVDGTIFDPLTVSLMTLAVGMFLSIFIGVGLGALMARFRTVEWALDVYINGLMAAPMVAFVPVFILLFGIGIETRILTVVVFAIFPIIINTFAGLRNVDPSIVEMAESFGASEWSLFWRVRVPASAPLLRAGIRLGTARGVKGLINGEVLVAVVGLGALVNQYGTAFSMDRLYALIFFIVALALVIVWLAGWVTRQLVRA